MSSIAISFKKYLHLPPSQVFANFDGGLLEFKFGKKIFYPLHPFTLFYFAFLKTASVSYLSLKYFSLIARSST